MLISTYVNRLDHTHLNEMKSFLQQVDVTPLTLVDGALSSPVYEGQVLLGDLVRKIYNIVEERCFGDDLTLQDSAIGMDIMHRLEELHTDLSEKQNCFTILVSFIGFPIIDAKCNAKWFRDNRGRMEAGFRAYSEERFVQMFNDQNKKKFHINSDGVMHLLGERSVNGGTFRRVAREAAIRSQLDSLNHIAHTG